MGLQWFLMRRDWRSSGDPRILHTWSGKPWGDSQGAQHRITYCPLYWFARAAMTKYHSLGNWNNGNVLSSYSLRGQKSGTTVSAALIPSVGCEGRICSRPLSSWLVGGHLLPVSLYVIFPLCPSVPRFHCLSILSNWGLGHQLVFFFFF